VPLVPYADTGDDFVNELIVLGVSQQTIAQILRETSAYMRTLSSTELRERARLYRRIKRTGA
jgi:hypothetical protein